MWAMTLWNHPAPTLQWGVVILASIIAAMTDLASRRIPNWLTFPLLLSGLVHAGIVGSQTTGIWAGLLDGFSAMLLLAFPYVILFFLRGGGGDAKLMGAIGAWIGLVNGLVVLGCVCASGVILAIAFAAMHGYAGQALANVRGIAYGLVSSVISQGKGSDSHDAAIKSAAPSPESMMQMPYGLAIVVGVCISAAGVMLWRN